MSHYLDQAACSDAQRREDLARNDAAMAEPSQEDWVLFDAERDADKGPRLAARNDARAIEWQLIDFRARGLL